MRKDFKNLDIYAAFQPANGAEWQKANGIRLMVLNGKRLTVSPLTGKHRNTLK
ncbi:methylmalonyl-CoA mutase [Bacteroides cellulosilyticus CAG:158]|nr:methylmalonyl-CoA mutase [Bacteroides cellulosilyticus CAG:158]